MVEGDYTHVFYTHVGKNVVEITGLHISPAVTRMAIISMICHVAQQNWGYLTEK